MGRKTTNYQNTIIYVIKCRDDNITEEYIGSTTNFNDRKCQHKNACNNEKNKAYNELKYKFIRDNEGWDNWLMLEVLKYPCNDKNEARMKEEEIRVERKAKLNSIKAFGAETKREYDKLYREENKEDIQNYRQQYYEEHRDEIKEQSKIYREEHKYQMFEYHKQYREEHKDKIKQYRDQNKEENKQYCKIYREEHKDEISNKGKTQKWTCLICNKEMREDSKKRHNRTFHLEIK